MKKLIAIMAFACLTMTATAQEESPVKKYSVATNSFWSNWFVQAGVNYNAWYSNQEHEYKMGLNTSPLKGFRSTPAMSVAIGKWFTPGIGLRTKLSGFWGRGVNGSNEEANKMKYWALNEQILLNMSNLFCGYNPNRVWNFIPFAGGFIFRNMTASRYDMGMSIGILNEFKVSKRAAINFEIGLNCGNSDFDGTDGNFGVSTSRWWDSHDENVYAEVGLTYNIGRVGWDKTPDVDAIKAMSQAQIDALNAQLNDANAENARLKKMLAEQPKVVETPQSVKEFVTTPVSVFFNLDKIDVASQKDLVNVRALAKYAKDNNSNILVNGYADNSTGTTQRNQWLSENRANTVAEELVKMGIARDKIKTIGNGGVDELSPVSFNRRATAQIAE